MRLLSLFIVLLLLPSVTASLDEWNLEAGSLNISVVEENYFLTATRGGTTFTFRSTTSFEPVLDDGLVTLPAGSLLNIEGTVQATLLLEDELTFGLRGGDLSLEAMLQPGAVLLPSLSLKKMAFSDPITGRYVELSGVVFRQALIAVEGTSLEHLRTENLWYTGVGEDISLRLGRLDASSLHFDFRGLLLEVDSWDSSLSLDSASGSESLPLLSDDRGVPLQTVKALENRLESDPLLLPPLVLFLPEERSISLSNSLLQFEDGTLVDLHPSVVGGYLSLDERRLLREQQTSILAFFQEDGVKERLKECTLEECFPLKGEHLLFAISRFLILQDMIEMANVSEPVFMLSEFNRLESRCEESSHQWSDELCSQLHDARGFHYLRMNDFELARQMVSSDAARELVDTYFIFDTALRARSLADQQYIAYLERDRSAAEIGAMWKRLYTKNTGLREQTGTLLATLGYALNLMNPLYLFMKPLKHSLAESTSTKSFREDYLLLLATRRILDQLEHPQTRLVNLIDSSDALAPSPEEVEAFKRSLEGQSKLDKNPLPVYWGQTYVPPRTFRGTLTLSLEGGTVDLSAFQGSAIIKVGYLGGEIIREKETMVYQDNNLGGLYTYKPPVFDSVDGRTFRLLAYSGNKQVSAIKWDGSPEAMERAFAFEVSVLSANEKSNPLLRDFVANQLPSLLEKDLIIGPYLDAKRRGIPSSQAVLESLVKGAEGYRKTPGWAVASKILKTVQQNYEIDSMEHNGNYWAFEAKNLYKDVEGVGFFDLSDRHIHHILYFAEESVYSLTNPIFLLGMGRVTISLSDMMLSRLGAKGAEGLSKWLLMDEVIAEHLASALGRAPLLANAVRRSIINPYTSLVLELGTLEETSFLLEENGMGEANAAVQPLLLLLMASRGSARLLLQQVTFSNILSEKTPASIIAKTENGAPLYIIAKETVSPIRPVRDGDIKTFNVGLESLRGESAVGDGSIPVIDFGSQGRIALLPEGRIPELLSRWKSEGIPFQKGNAEKISSFNKQYSFPGLHPEPKEDSLTTDPWELFEGYISRVDAFLRTRGQTLPFEAEQVIADMRAARKAYLKGDDTLFNRLPREYGIRRNALDLAIQDARVAEARRLADKKFLPVEREINLRSVLTEEQITARLKFVPVEDYYVLYRDGQPLNSREPILFDKGSGKREQILVHPEDEALWSFYDSDVRPLVESMVKERGVPRSVGAQKRLVHDILIAVGSTTRKALPTSGRASRYVASRGASTHEAVLLGSLFESGGVCRHYGALNAVYIARLIEDGLLPRGFAAYNRGLAHGWAEYVYERPKFLGGTSPERFVVDVATDHFGWVEQLRGYSGSRGTFYKDADPYNYPYDVYLEFRKTGIPPKQLMQQQLVNE